MMTTEALNGSNAAESGGTSTLSAEKTMHATAHEEYQYLDLIGQILRDGEHRPDRYVLQAARRLIG